MSDKKPAQVSEQIEGEDVIRYDAAPTLNIVRQDNGFLKVGATVGRTGILEYRQPDGSVRRELRSPEEVFSTESLQSLALITVTLDHPSRQSPDFGLVRADNIKKLAVGHGGDSPTRSGEKLNLNLMITDETAIGAVEAGVRQISPGYQVKLDHTPGTFQGQPYDAKQTNIRYNHIAIVERGRAGPSVRLHLDSDAVETVSQPETEDMPVMVKLNLDGVDFECSEQLKQALEASNAKKDNELTAVKAQLSEVTAKADAADAELAKAKTRCDELDSPERLRNAVNARLGLERAATKVLGDEVKLDELSDNDIMTKVVVKAYPTMEARLTEKADDASYLAASFDLAVQSEAVKPTEALGTARADAETVEVKADAASARADFIKAQNDAWKTPLSLGKGN